MTKPPATKRKAREWRLLVMNGQYLNGDDIAKWYRDPRAMPQAKWVRVREIITPREKKA